MSEEEDEDEECFFESLEEIRSGGESGSETDAQQASCAPRYEPWTNSPYSIQERRQRLFHVLGLEESLKTSSPTSPPSSDLRSATISPHSALDVQLRIHSPRPLLRSISVQSPRFDANARSDEAHPSIERLQDSSGAVVSTSYGECPDNSEQSWRENSGQRQTNSRGSFASIVQNVKDGMSASGFGCRIKDLDTGKEYELGGSNGLWNKLRQVDNGREYTLEEFESYLGLSPLIKRVHRRSVSVAKRKKGWLQRINFISLSSKTKEKTTNDVQMHKVKVRAHNKSCKEFAELHMKQEIQAHDGTIQALKFCPYGRYLASGGHDCIVRVWEVQAAHRNGNGNCNADVAGNSGSSKSRKSTSRTSATASPTVGFSLAEKAICTFRGHTEGILDLSWSPKFLLSSSMDKTVRLWHLSQEDCLQTFLHNDYVTCIQFNPVDDKYFLSGSLDHKVRIWSIPDHQVVAWTDVREIVTAVCYMPDAKRVMVGSLKGCRLYDSSENKLQLTVEELKYKGKRSKKITGVQCIPGSPHKLLLTSNDSCIRTFELLELTCKYTGFRNGICPASFSADGDFIVCGSEDSRVYIWNVMSSKGSSSKSYEDFYCHKLRVALPWPPPSVPSIGNSENENENENEIEIDNENEVEKKEKEKEKDEEGCCWSKSSTCSSRCASDSECGGGLCSEYFDGSSRSLQQQQYHNASNHSSTSQSQSQSHSQSQSQSQSQSPSEDSTSGWGGLVIVASTYDGFIRSFQNQF